jgi:hypothetical protein
VAASDVLPRARETVSGGAGEYRLPALPPGTYTLTFTLSGMQTVTRRAQVLLAQETAVDVTMGVASATIKSAVSASRSWALPVGQEYRDLQKLIPGVQFTQDQVRGPSAGGSGQDNVYQFDGVNVTLPLFGTLSAEPASHDIAQVTRPSRAARARSTSTAPGGFTIDSVSKSGTSRSGQLSYQFQNADGGRPRQRQPVALRAGPQLADGQRRRPVIQNKLFFYGSYYRPEIARENRANLYGELPDYESTRNEGFGKLTFTPTATCSSTPATATRSARTPRPVRLNASATTGTGRGRQRSAPRTARG